MNKKNPLLTDTEELFIAGTGNLAEFEHRLCKQKGSTILFCHNGRAKFTIDLKEYEIKSLNIDDRKIDGGYPSDHYPVICELELK